MTPGQKVAFLMLGIVAVHYGIDGLVRWWKRAPETPADDDPIRAAFDRGDWGRP